jgi:hypothetical protein
MYLSRKTMSRMPVLIFMIVVVSQITACSGNSSTAAPFGSTINITGPFNVSNDTTIQTTKLETYHIEVFDAAGLPMSGIKVQLNGIFTTGDKISMNGSIPLDAPTTIINTVKMGDGGYNDFVISAPTLSIRPLALPQFTNVTALSSGGTLAVATYSYEVAAVDTIGGLAVSGLVTASTTTAGSSVELSWTTVPGAVSYRVYGDDGAGNWSIKTNVTGTTLYTDTAVGGAPATQPVPLSNSTGVALNTLTGSIMAVSGGINTIIDVNF